ncbi:MAG: hypothetical protein GWO00_24015, partial [Gemmatimonadetes bacterium]|nr:hypothetical protein [Gemmatimonadota bacterium]NIR81302.1 hypothetical protein [Gemmatimonadota bacterium]NIU33963.1 hypothetical protein [Gemmatimonadota bacterium]NIW65292.1 hypothetical protein [Gemmatimonadota bacterium]NIX48821.1 hypothetical protein [Gemmatimonadota bacterium]
MEELIFFAIIIIFSILESIARSRKGKRQEGEGEVGGPTEWEARLPEPELPGRGPRRRQPGDRLPTYDEEPSYDEQPSYDERAEGHAGGGPGRPLERYTTPGGMERPAGAGRVGGDRPSSQTMLPGDLLEQLEALARGRKADREKGRTIDLPRQSPPLPPRPAPIERSEVGSEGPVGSTAPVGSRTPIDATPVEHEIHRAHEGYGTDPSTRAPSEQDLLG